MDETRRKERVEQNGTQSQCGDAMSSPATGLLSYPFTFGIYLHLHVGTSKQVIGRPIRMGHDIHGIVMGKPTLYDKMII